jgi:hypothetical protein
VNVIPVDGEDSLVAADGSLSLYAPLLFDQKRKKKQRGVSLSSSWKEDASKRKAYLVSRIKRRNELRLGRFGMQILEDRSVGIPSPLVPALQPVALRPRPSHERQVRHAHEGLDRPIEREDEGEVGEAEDPGASAEGGVNGERFFADDELEDVCKVSGA